LAEIPRGKGNNKGENDFRMGPDILGEDLLEKGPCVEDSAICVRGGVGREGVWLWILGGCGEMWGGWVTCLGCIVVAGCGVWLRGGVCWGGGVWGCWGWVPCSGGEVIGGGWGWLFWLGFLGWGFRCGGVGVGAGVVVLGSLGKKNGNLKAGIVGFEEPERGGKARQKFWHCMRPKALRRAR